MLVVTFHDLFDFCGGSGRPVVFFWRQGSEAWVLEPRVLGLGPPGTCHPAPWNVDLFREKHDKRGLKSHNLWAYRITTAICNV